MDVDERTKSSLSPGVVALPLDLGLVGCVEAPENTAQDPQELNQLQSNLTMNQVEDKVNNGDDKSGSIPGIARMSLQGHQGGGDIGGVVPESNTIEGTDSTDDDDDINKLNQLQTNPIIVELIAKELPIDDLSTLRQSCKFWNQSFVSELAGRGGPIVELVPAEAARSLVSHPHWNGHDVKLLQDYTNLMRPSLLIPYSHYKIYQLQVGELSRPDFLDFFSVCGQSIKKLSLECHWDQEEVSLDRIREVIFELTPQLTSLSLTLNDCRPKSTRGTSTDSTESEKKSNISVMSHSKLPSLNLQEFKMIIPFRTEESIPPHCPHDGLVADLLNSAPHLECLSLEKVGPQLAVLKILSTLHKSISVLLNLNYLNTLLLPRLRIKEIRILAEDLGPRLRLQNLVMSVWQVTKKEINQEIADLLHQFLSTQASSLCEFRICFELVVCSDEETVPFRTPRLEQLRTFGFRRMRSAVLVRYDGGTLEANFPRLKRFEYKSLEYSEVSEELKHIFHAGVTELVLDVDQWVGNHEFYMSLFAQRFPSVRKLDFGIILVTGRPPFSIWTAWPELTSMRLRFETEEEQTLDELLTGVPRHFHRSQHWIQTMLQSRTTGESQVFSHLLENWQFEPGLRDLKKLEDFKLVLTVEDEDHDGASALGDFGGCLGLAMANPGLKRMEIHFQPKSSLNTSRFPSKTKWTNKQFFTPQCKEFIRSAFARHASINIQIADSRYNQEPNYIYPF